MFQGVSSSSLELPEYPSARAKQVSERFVGYLSQKNALPISTLHKKPQLISKEKKAELIEIFKRTVDELSEKRPNSEFYLVGKGKHHAVWGHAKYPKIVFKLMAHEDAAKQEKVACQSLEVTQQIEHCWVQIPRATLFEINQFSVYVEEKLPLALNMEEHREFWARVISHYQSSNATASFKSNFENMIEHISILIEKVGFWDVGYHNLPEVRADGKGVCGTDFENINSDLRNLPEGLFRLASLVPIPPFSKSLAIKYETYVPLLHARALEMYEQEKSWGYIKEPKQEIIMQKFHLEQAEKKDGLKALQTALAYYDEKGWFHGAEAIPDSPDLGYLGAKEQILANFLINKFQESLQETTAKQCLSERRCLHVQPGGCLECPDVYTHEGFLKVLETLRDQGLAISWVDDFAYKEAVQLDLSYVSYYIYF
jgi:hypothetical protein